MALQQVGIDGAVGQLAERATVVQCATTREDMQAAAAPTAAEFECGSGHGPDAVEVGDDEECLVERK